MRVHQVTKAGRLPVDIELGCEAFRPRYVTQNLPAVAAQPTQGIAELEKILVL